MAAMLHQWELQTAADTAVASAGSIDIKLAHYVARELWRELANNYSPGGPERPAKQMLYCKGPDCKSVGAKHAAIAGKAWLEIYITLDDL